MAETRQVELLVLRYVPDAVKGERVNIGLVLVETGGDGNGFSEIRFTKDWRRVQCIDPYADVEVLQALGRELMERIKVATDRPQLMKIVNESFSGVVEAAVTKGCLTSDPAREVENLSKLYLEHSYAPRPAARSGRELIVRRMEEEFARVNLSDRVIRDIAASEYTGGGNPDRYDFGYRVGNEIKLFQALSLKIKRPSLGWAYRYPDVADAITRKKGWFSSLTAVVEDGLPFGEVAIDFALSELKKRNIAVRPVAEMPSIADQALLELGG